MSTRTKTRRQRISSCSTSLMAASDSECATNGLILTHHYWKSLRAEPWKWVLT
jgi:hypothetical protein